jgi:STE24 endopeptidase
MNEDKASRYQRLRRRAIVLAAVWPLLLLVALLLTGGSHALRDLSESVMMRLPLPAGIRSAAATALFVFVLLIIHEVGALPVAFWAGVTLERRYGLSRQPSAAWLRDHLKGAGITSGLVVVAAVWTTTCQRLAPAWWWLGVWLAAVTGSVLLAWVAPVWLFPVFHRFTVLTHDGLRDRLESLAARAGVPVLSVFEGKLGDRTSRPNAALVGLGRTRRILVSDTLVADYTEDEVEAVLAHELAHHVQRDVWRTLAFQALIFGLGLWAAHIVLARLAAPLVLRNEADVAGLPLVALCLAVFSGLARPVGLALSRGQERRADRLALDLTARPDAFASAIRRLSARHLAEDDPPLWVTVLFCSHPSVRDRLACAGGWGPPDSGRASTGQGVIAPGRPRSTGPSSSGTRRRS